MIYLGAIYVWNKSNDKPNTLTRKKLYMVVVSIVVIGFAFSYLTNYIGYGGNMSTLAYITTIAFAFSLVGNGLNIFKLSTQWQFCLFYNIVQVVKALVQGNFANVGKYIFYIINSIGALFVWKDSEK